MTKCIDLTGKRFGNLMVIKRNGSKKYRTQSRPLWECRCDCGNIINVEGQSLRNGITTHCGCNNKCIIDLTGRVFGRITVIKKSDKKAKVDRSQYWQCECSCGSKNFAVSAHSLISGNAKSCGCLQKERVSEAGKKNKGRKNPALSVGVGVASFNALYSRYKRDSERRGIEFNLNREDFKLLTSMNCSYCQSSPSQAENRPNFNGIYLYNGIDRMNPFKGYNIENCVPCCGRCNWMKSAMTMEDFLEKVQNIQKTQMLKWSNEKIEDFIKEIALDKT